MIKSVKNIRKLDNVKILFLSNDDTIKSAVESEFDDYFKELKLVKSANEAFSLLKEHKFDMLLIDSQMNDKSFKEFCEMIIQSKLSIPKIIISSDVKQTVSKLQFEFPKILTLYLMNKSKYDEIGAGKLFEAYRMMETYSFGKKYSPQDVLSDLSNDNPDDLMKFLFLFNKIMEFYSNENFGLLISTCNKEFKYFSSNSFQIHKHGDKKLLKEKFEK
ncbi:MAG: response regulator, partial [Arcobacteraceae bacterium]